MNQINIPVTNVRKSIEFYEKLGLKLIEQSFPDFARFSCPDETSTFTLHRVRSLAMKDRVSIYFEVANLDEHIESLLAKGFVFEELPSDEPWLWRESRIKDLDDNQVIIYFGGNNTVKPILHN